MKKLLSILLSVLLLCACLPLGAVPVAAATSGTTGDCTWVLDGTHLTISGNGKMGNYAYSSRSPWGQTITAVTIEDGVTAIGDYAFEGCEFLTQISIADTVTTIGKYAFYGCLYLPSLPIPDSVAAIGEEALGNLVSLDVLNIGKNVTTIGPQTWMNVHADVVVSEENAVYASLNGDLYNKDKTELIYVSSRQEDTYVILDGVVAVADYAMWCPDVRKIVFPDSVKMIGVEAFGIGNLQEVVFGAGLEEIGRFAFACNGALTTVTFRNANTAVGAYAFDGCPQLSDVYYNGSETDRHNMQVKDNNTDLANAQWHYHGEDRHCYEDAYDTDCNVCGALRELPAQPDDPVASDAVIVISDAVGSAGDEVSVTIRLQNNPGIVSAVLRVGYDADALELISIKMGETYAAANPVLNMDNNPFVINFCDTLVDVDYTEELFATATFRIKEGAAAGTYPFTLTYSCEDDFFNLAWDVVDFDAQVGGVTVTLLGDVNGDGKVNNRDLGLLQQYLADFVVTINADACDVNGDGRVNNRDLGLLQQYLADMDVTLG